MKFRDNIYYNPGYHISSFRYRRRMNTIKHKSNYEDKNYDRIIARSHKPEIENIFDESYWEEYMSFFYRINYYYKSFKLIRNP